MASLLELLWKEGDALARTLKRRRIRLVLAESCTGGLIAATLARVPGISEHFCGSFVAYRNDSKSRWLGVSPKLIAARGAVSPAVAMEMAVRALERTPEASVAVSVTGHFGPGAPPKQDGLVFMTLFDRHRIYIEELRFSEPKRAGAAQRKHGAPLRVRRQLAASLAILFMVRSLLEGKARRSS